MYHPPVRPPPPLPAQDTSAAYSTLLRSEMLGENGASVLGASPIKSPPGLEGARQYSHSR